MTWAHPHAPTKTMRTGTLTTLHLLLVRLLETPPIPHLNRAERDAVGELRAAVAQPGKNTP